MTKREQIEHRYTLPVWRFYLIMGVCLLALASLAVRAAWIQVYDNEFLKLQGDSRVIRYQGLNGQRGIIKDRNGVELATSIPVHSVVVDPAIIVKEYDKYPDLFESSGWLQFASLVNKSGAQLADDIVAEAAAGKRYLFIKRHIDPTHASII